MPVLQADAVYQDGCFLGSALGRYVVARELIRVVQEQGCRSVAHSSATRGNDQLRLEAALASLSPDLEVLAPLRVWNLRDFVPTSWPTPAAAHLPLDGAVPAPASHGRPQPLGSQRLPGRPHRLLAGAAPGGLQHDPAHPPDAGHPCGNDPGSSRPGVPRGLDGRTLDLVPLVRELNDLAGTHGVGRRDVIEDRLFGLKVREFYEAPAATVLRLGHRELEGLVHSRELRNQKRVLARDYAALVYAGHWFQDLRRALQAFVAETQVAVTGEVRLRLFKGTCQILGRRSPNSLYDGRLASQVNASQCDSSWAQALSALWSLPGRLAALRQGERKLEGEIPS